MSDPVESFLSTKGQTDGGQQQQQRSFKSLHVEVETGSGAGYMLTNQTAAGIDLRALISHPRFVWL